MSPPSERCLLCGGASITLRNKQREDASEVHQLHFNLSHMMSWTDLAPEWLAGPSTKEVQDLRRALSFLNVYIISDGGH